MIFARATFIINPAYVGDAELLQKVSAALAKIKDLPADFIQPQAATTKTIVTEDSLTEVFKKKPNVIRELFDVVATVAVSKTKIDDVKIALERVNKFLAPAA